MSRISIVGRCPILANGMIGALRKNSQVLSYNSFDFLKFDLVKNSNEEFLDIDTLILCIDYRRDFVILDRIQQRKEQLKVVLVSNFNVAMIELYAVKYGIHAVIDYRIECDEFVRCIEQVYLTENSETLAIVRTTSQKLSVFDKYHLTRREHQVLQMISQSLSNKEIAKELFISDHTVSVHRKNLMKKMQVNNAAGLISKAFREEIITL